MRSFVIQFYFHLFAISMPNKSFILFKQKENYWFCSGFTTAKCPKKKQSTFWVEFEGRKGEIRGKNGVHLPQVTAIYGHSNTVWQIISMSWTPLQNLTVPISVPLLFSGLLFTVCRPSSTRKSLVIHARMSQNHESQSNVLSFREQSEGSSYLPSGHRDLSSIFRLFSTNPENLEM